MKYILLAKDRTVLGKIYIISAEYNYYIVPI